ncbi:hypothetical protein Tco_0305291 [Tanacetum coccineum]
MKNAMYHSRWIRYFLKLRQDQDHSFILKNTPYLHQQIRRIRYFGQHSEQARFTINTPYPEDPIRRIQWRFMNIPEYNNLARMERITINEYEPESDAFDLLKIDPNLFTCDTFLGTIFDEFRPLSSVKDDLFTYELGVYERMFAEVVILMDDRLVKLIDITLEQWLDLKLGDHKKVDKEIVEEVTLDFSRLDEIEDGDLDMTERLRMQHKGDNGGLRRQLSWRQFISIMGLHTMEEMETDREPLRRLCHQLIAFTVSSKGQEPEKVTTTDLLFLRSIDEGTMVNVP